MDHIDVKCQQKREQACLGHKRIFRFSDKETQSKRSRRTAVDGRPCANENDDDDEDSLCKLFRTASFDEDVQLADMLPSAPKHGDRFVWYSDLFLPRLDYTTGYGNGYPFLKMRTSSESYDTLECNLDLESRDDQ